MNVGQAVIPSLEFERQLGVVDSQAMQNRRVQVVDVDRILDDVVREIVGRPVSHARLDTAAGVRTSIITRGASGCIVVSNERRFQAEAHRVEFVDGTGSGDAFVSGYILGMLRGADVAQCVTLGSAMGASCVRSTGATTGVFSAPELEAFVASHSLPIVEAK